MKTRHTILFLFTIIFVFSNQAIAQENVFFGNLHSHTSYTDGSGTPEEAYKHARDVAHLDFLAITEHNHSSAGKIANNPELYKGPASTSLIKTAGRFNIANRFVAIYGQEYSSISEGNHANVFEVGEVITAGNGKWKELETWLKTNKDSEGKDAILLLNHPAIAGSPANKEYGIDDFGTMDNWRAFIDKHVRLMNMVNGPSHDQDKPGSPSESEFKRYLNMGLHVAPTADQDNHRTNWGSAADTRTAIIAPSLTKASLFQAIRERHVYATQDKNLEIIAKVENKLMGEIFAGVAQMPPTTRDLNITISLTDGDEEFVEYDIEVYQDEVGGPVTDMIARIHKEGNGTITIPGVRYKGKKEYIYFKIKQTDSDGEALDLAWTAPVWFEPDATPPSGPNPNPITVTAVSLTVDEVNEEALITNHGTNDVSVKGWVLLSVIGEQRFTITKDLKIKPGATLKVISGLNPAAIPASATDRILWDKKNFWNNTGDPGKLFDKDGVLVAEHQVNLE